MSQAWILIGVHRNTEKRRGAGSSKKFSISATERNAKEGHIVKDVFHAREKKTISNLGNEWTGIGIRTTILC